MGDEFIFGLEVHMSEQDLDVLITLDDPGEDELEEDTFHNRQAENESNVSQRKRQDHLTDDSS